MLVMVLVLIHMNVHMNVSSTFINCLMNWFRSILSGVLAWASNMNQTEGPDEVPGDTTAMLTAARSFGIWTCAEKFVPVGGRSRYGRIKPFPAKIILPRRRHVVQLLVRLPRMNSSFRNVASQNTENIERLRRHIYVTLYAIFTTIIFLIKPMLESPLGVE